MHIPNTGRLQRISNRIRSIRIPATSAAIALFLAMAFALVVVRASIGSPGACFSGQANGPRGSFDMETAQQFSWILPAALTESPGQAIDKPVEQVRKNIQILKGLPDSQLFLVMNFVGDSLGVHCDYCHVKGEKNPQTGADNWLWERDDKPTKLVGRDMMRMVLELNRTKFNREAVVTCYTCHRGSTRPERMTPIPPRDFVKEALGPESKRVLPTVQEVVAKYLSAIGSNRQEILSQAIVMRGTVERVERANASGPTEIVFKQPNKLRFRETTTSGVITRGTNGTTGWSQTAGGITQITGERLKQVNASVVQLFAPVKLPDSVNRATVAGLTRVDDRDAYLLTIDDNSTQSTRLFFDAESGLLLRTINVTNTMLGPLNVQWDFSDYKDIGGIKLPFIIRTSDVAAFDTTVRKFSEIKI